MNAPSTGFRPIDRSQHTLLVVDDDPVSRYATARMLRSAGFRTREAATGAEGLSGADGSITAMVLDVHLPDMDGFELCRVLRSRPETERLPVLHLTAAYVTDEDKVRGLDSGADAYLTRPVEPAVLVATVQALVRTAVAEAAMRRSEGKFRAIYDHAPSGIALFDDDGRIVDANPTMLGFIGRRADEVIGHRLSEFVPPDWADRVETTLRRIGPTLARHDFPVVDRSGGTVQLDWSLSPHIEPRLNMAVATDISERVLLEQQRQQLLDRERVARGHAEQLSRLKDDFIAVLSHELRAPLNAILGWTHVLQHRGGNDEFRRALNAIERNGKLQGQMIADLLDMSRLNVGKLPMHFETLDPEQVLASAVNALRPSSEDNAVQIRLDLRPPYRPIRGDGARLQQVLWNLLSNAVKFSSRGGTVRITAVEDDEGLSVCVIDEGQGIKPDFLPFVFDRFSQSDAASNRLQGGLGLGLSIVKQLVEAHGGRVTAHSEGVGRGATFEVWLPREPSLRDADDSMPSVFDPLESTGPSLAGLQLLIVEDDPDASALLQIILGDRGADVKAAYDCDTALKLLETLEPDLIVSDVGMPGKDGYDLIREVRRREAGSGRRLPAIALTSFTRTQDQEQALEAGFDAHCAKPLRPLKLVQQIEKLLALPGFRPSS